MQVYEIQEHIVYGRLSIHFLQNAISLVSIVCTAVFPKIQCKSPVSQPLSFATVLAYSLQLSFLHKHGETLKFIIATQNLRFLKKLHSSSPSNS